MSSTDVPVESAIVIPGTEHTADTKNPGTTIIFIIIILAIIIAIVAMLLSISNNTPAVPPSKACDSATPSTDITNTTVCPGSITKYMPDLNMLAGPTAVPYQTVCRSFCPGGHYNTENDTCPGLTTGTAQAQFNTCISQLKPVQCIGPANPVAVSNGILYYGQSKSSGC
jgi:hypothetical protein